MDDPLALFQAEIEALAKKQPASVDGTSGTQAPSSTSAPKAEPTTKPTSSTSASSGPPLKKVKTSTTAPAAVVVAAAKPVVIKAQPSRNYDSSATVLAASAAYTHPAANGMGNGMPSGLSNSASYPYGGAPGSVGVGSYMSDPSQSQSSWQYGGTVGSGNSYYGGGTTSGQYPPTVYNNSSQQPYGGYGQQQQQQQNNGKGRKKHLRAAGGEVWEDPTLADWPENDFRIFCGDLGNDVSDELLAQAFSKYSTFQRARVIRDKHTFKTRGFGFVSFSDPFDCAKALREMNGKYVGNRPIKLRKGKWKDRDLETVVAKSTDNSKKRKNKKHLLGL